MRFEIDDAIEVLERTPATLASMLEGLGDSWVRSNEGGETWSPYDIVGHLIHGEKTDWIPRARTILEQGGAQPFTPFDRFAQFEDSKGSTLSELLSQFGRLRAANLEILRALELTDADLGREGTHPEFGTVTLRQLLATWTVHDLGHIAQAARVMAHQYKVEAGPWERYLSILHRRPS